MRKKREWVEKQKKWKIEGGNRKETFDGWMYLPDIILEQIFQYLSYRVYFCKLNFIKNNSPIKTSNKIGIYDLEIMNCLKNNSSIRFNLNIIFKSNCLLNRTAFTAVCAAANGSPPLASGLCGPRWTSLAAQWSNGDTHMP